MKGISVRRLGPDDLGLRVEAPDDVFDHVVLHPDRARPELFINEVGVAEPYRRHGIGRRLMAETLRVAGERGCRGAWVAVDEDNDAALGLYRAAGGAPPERQVHIDFGYATPEAEEEA